MWHSMEIAADTAGLAFQPSMPIGPRFALAPAGRSRLVPLHQSTAAIAHSCTGPLKEDALILAITSSSHETGLKPTFTATCRRRWRSICESPASLVEPLHPAPLQGGRQDSCYKAAHARPAAAADSRCAQSLVTGHN